MAKETKAIKSHKKAQSIKGAALGTFTEAKMKVEEANALLEQSIELDNQTITSIENQISDLNINLAETTASVVNKSKEISENNELIERLNKFAN